ncbi:MAG TPA: helix-turn-helix domain-containing protein [Opitutaceae bacterium]|nr:helix-turn-helix domain-containing protein [Opitutaceae bacterium]
MQPPFVKSDSLSLVHQDPFHSENLAEAKDQDSDNRALIDALTNSKIYREYERAFSNMTGLSMTLQPVDPWKLPHHGKRNENHFCALISRWGRVCASCLQVQARLVEKAAMDAQTISCPTGLCEIAVPVRLSGRLIGFLQTGQLFRKKPNPRQFARTARLMAKWGVDLPSPVLKKAYFASRHLSHEQQESLIKLLTIFAQHLAMLSNQVFIERENAEPPSITRAREHIQEFHAEELSLGRVAKAVNMSPFHFCKVFKKTTGINFTDYVSRVRIEKSKNLLINPHLRVSEIAFAVGFQSLTHFNRVFRRLLGQSPSDYRAQSTAQWNPDPKAAGTPGPAPFSPPKTAAAKNDEQLPKTVKSGGAVGGNLTGPKFSAN